MAAVSKKKSQELFILGTKVMAYNMFLKAVTVKLNYSKTKMK